METFALIICIVGGLAATSLSVLKGMHMLQLNSYSNVTHLKWMVKNPSRHTTNLLSLGFMAFALLLNVFAVHLLLALVMPIIAVAVFPRVKPKKPLVFTGRVIRMLVTCGVLTLLALWLILSIPAPYSYAAVYALYFISAFFPVAANTINMPIEAAARRYYTEDAKKMLAASPNLTVIGITGSYGKTSVKYYLTTLLKARYNVLMTPESFNTPMGIVKTIREQLRSTHEIFVCEMGARRTGEIKELCDIVSPKHGIITSIGEQHLETFKTVDNIVKTKLELADAVAGNGVIFLNGDNELIRNNMPKQQYVTYGLGAGNDYRAYNIRVSRNGTEFSIVYEGNRLEGLKTRLIGEHNVLNLVGAIAMSIYFGVSADDIRLRLQKLSSPPHRLQLSETNGATIIDDAYNSNPHGCEAALKTLSLFDEYKILVTPGMVELGVQEEQCNYEFGIKAAKVCDFVILVGEKQTRPIHQGLLDGGYTEDKIYVADTINDALAHAYSVNTGAQRVILLENDLPDNY